MANYGLQVLERRIRAMTFDTRHSDFEFDPDVVAFAIDRSMAAVFQKLLTPPTLVTALVTLAANDYDYALSDTYNNVDSLNGFRLVSTGQPIIKKDLPTLQMYRTGNPVQTGDPLIVAFSESAAGAETAYFWPTPWQADTVEATLGVAYSDTDPSFRVVGRENYDPDGLSLSMPGNSSRAVVYRAAAELLEAASDEKLAKLGVNRGVAGLYMAHYREALSEEIAREHKLRRPGHLVQRNAF